MEVPKAANKDKAAPKILSVMQRCGHPAKKQVFLWRKALRSCLRNLSPLGNQVSFFNKQKVKPSSKKIPTDFWNIPQVPQNPDMKRSPSYTRSLRSVPFGGMLEFSQRLSTHALRALESNPTITNPQDNNLALGNSMRPSNSIFSFPCFSGWNI